MENILFLLDVAPRDTPRACVGNGSETLGAETLPNRDWTVLWDVLRKGEKSIPFKFPVNSRRNVDSYR